ncbi:MAG: hypothetical protein ACRDAM_13880, partial [Casimicrobium sp.]
LPKKDSGSNVDPCETALGNTNKISKFFELPFADKVAIGGEASVKQAIALPSEQFLILGDFAIVENGTRYASLVLTTADGRIDPRFRLPHDLFATEMQRHGNDHIIVFGESSGDELFKERKPYNIMYSLRDHAIVWSNNYRLSPSERGDYLYGRIGSDPTVRRISKASGQLDPSWSWSDASQAVGRISDDGYGSLWGVIDKRTSSLTSRCTFGLSRVKLTAQGVGGSLTIPPAVLPASDSQKCPRYGFDERYFYTQFGRMDLSNDAISAVGTPDTEPADGPFFTKNYVHWFSRDENDQGYLWRMHKTDVTKIERSRYENLRTFFAKPTARDADAFALVTRHLDNDTNTHSPRFFFSDDNITTSKSVQVVEYFVKPLERYFMTGRDDEQKLLDALSTDFIRTGMTFTAIEPKYVNPPEKPVCRFYASPLKGMSNTHFYSTGDECAMLKVLPSLSYETYDFAIKVPTGGVCPADAPRGVRRMYNNRFATNDSNHRYVTSDATRDAMLARGWIDEGIRFCATAAQDATR